MYKVTLRSFFFGGATEPINTLSFSDISISSVRVAPLLVLPPCSYPNNEKEAISNNVKSFLHNLNKAGALKGMKISQVSSIFNHLKSLNNQVLTLMRDTEKVIDSRDTLVEELHLLNEDCAKTALDHFVCNVIKYSDGSGSNTFTTFKTYFNE